MCELSGVMNGSIIPYDVDVLAGEPHAAMIQTLSGVSVSVVSEGTCTPTLEFPAGMDVISFNYVANAY